LKILYGASSHTAYFIFGYLSIRTFAYFAHGVYFQSSNFR
jgi:hypothetical protein